MFEHACKLGLEGVVSERRDAPYRSGRSRAWLKVKNPESPASAAVARRAMVTHVLRRANVSRDGGTWSDDDFDVLEWRAQRGAHLPAG
jgi:ATP-dependent DNA ligase